MTTQYFNPAILEEFAAGVLRAQGLPKTDASLVARGLLLANLRGLDSHGIARIPIYAGRLRAKVVNPRPNIAIDEVTPVVASVDGDDGMGFVVGHQAMTKAIEIASSYGIALAGVRNSTHYGMAALYVLQAIDAGMIGMAFTNSSPAMPVWGGRTVFLGAAPFAAGVPSKQREPFVLDMAMTVIARGKIRLAAQRGDPIPEGLALDGEGKPTTDAAKAFDGVLLPFGDVKGSALGMLMDILSGVFTGAAYGGQVRSLYNDMIAPQNVGHLFIVIRPDLFVSGDGFLERMDDMIDMAKDSPRAEGFEEILIPGEPEKRNMTARSATGIPITSDVLKTLAEEASLSGVALPLASANPLDLSAEPGSRAG